MNEDLFPRFTLLLASAALVPTVVFFALSLVHREMPQWRLGAFGFLAVFGASATAALRGELPEYLSIPFSNALVGAGYFLLIASAKEIDRPKVFSFAHAVFLLAVAVSATFALIPVDYETRVAMMSLCLFLFSADILCARLRSQRGLGDALIVTFAVGNCTIAFVRALGAAVDTGIPALSLGVIDPVFFVWSIGGIFLFASGIFLNGMAAITRSVEVNLEREKRLTGQLTAAIEEQANLKQFMLHELKRPIAAMAAAAEAALAAGKGSEAEADLRRLRGIAADAARYVREIGDYEELSPLLDTPVRERVRLLDIAEDIETKWRIPVSVNFDVSGHEILADPFLIDIALGNIIENGLKFGDGRVACAMRLCPGSATVQIDVSDDGPGIPPEYRTDVWKKFWRSPQESVRTAPGCGLGLYLARRIAEIHGGTTEVAGQRRSTIRVTLPLQGTDKPS